MVIYRFLSFTGPEIPEPNETNFSVKPLAIKPPDTFTIDVSYRDPFLGKMYNPANAPITKKTRTKIIKEPIAWPQVIYRGIVSDVKDKKKVFMVIINGQTYLMSEKDIEQDVTIKNGNRQFITVKYKGEQNIIPIQP